MPVLLREMNDRLGKAKFNSLSILLDSGASSSFILGKKLKHCERKRPMRSVGVHKEVTLIINIPVK